MSGIHSLISKSLLMLGLILISLNIAGWMKKREFKYFGETAMCITVGLAVAIIFRLFSLVLHEDILHDVQLSTNFFYMVLLPPIIFEGGYSVHRLAFFKNLPLIFSLAFIGGIYSTIVIAVLIYLFSLMLSKNVSMVESLIFGSLISSTDPVTILAMLPPETDRRLNMVIFGESALNDAVAIILYRFFSSLADPSLTLTAWKFSMSLLESLWVFAGSFAVGAIAAMLFAKLTKHLKLTHEAEIYEVTMMLVFAYSAYLLAEVMHLTGIISVFFCGVAMAHYGRPNMAADSLHVSKKMLRVFSTICEHFIFMYLGMGLVAFPTARYDAGFVIAALFAIAAGRTHVFPICSASNLAQSQGRMSLGKQTFVWFSGLRGAVAFALAVQLLENEFVALETRALIFGTAIIVIVTTVYGLNVLTPPLISRLDITTPSAAIARPGESTQSMSVAIPDHGGSGGGNEDADGPESDAVANSEGGFLAKLYHIDIKYLRPFLCASKSGGTAQMDAEYAKLGDDPGSLTLLGPVKHKEQPKEIERDTMKTVRSDASVDNAYVAMPPSQETQNTGGGSNPTGYRFPDTNRRKEIMMQEFCDDSESLN